MENEKLSVIRKVVEEGFGRADLSVIDQLMGDNCIEHQFGMKGGKEGLKKAVLSLAKAFSNRNYELINFSISGDIVWVHYKATGKHTGFFMGREASGDDFAIDVIDIARVVDGQIAEHWGVPDRFALLTQLGFLQPAINIKP
ncbi:MAG TPA: ester cyclase [Puia sp.]|nr:ester cyclase [Puia sp.]